MTTTLTDLPDDLLLLIATFLTTVDLIRLEWTCTELRHLLFPQHHQHHQDQQDQQQHHQDQQQHHRSRSSCIAYRTILQHTELRIPFFPDIHSAHHNPSSPSSSSLHHDDNDDDSDTATDGGVRDHRRLCHRIAFLQHHMRTQRRTAITEDAAPPALRRMRVHLRGLSRAGKTLTALRWKSLGLSDLAASDSDSGNDSVIDDHTLHAYSETVDFRMGFVRVAVPRALTPARGLRDSEGHRQQSSLHSLQILDHTGNVESAAGASSSPLAAAMFNTPGMVTGFAIVFDLTDMRSLLSCAHWIRDMRASVAMPFVMTAPHFSASPNGSNDSSSSNDVPPPLLLIGNKLDMYDPAQHSHILHAATGLARDNHCPLVLQSARNDINCQLSMELLVACMTRVEGIEWATHFSSGPPAAVTQSWWHSSIRLLQLQEQEQEQDNGRPAQSNSQTS